MGIIFIKFYEKYKTKSKKQGEQQQQFQNGQKDTLSFRQQHPATGRRAPLLLNHVNRIPMLANTDTDTDSDTDSDTVFGGTGVRTWSQLWTTLDHRTADGFDGQILFNFNVRSEGNRDGHRVRQELGARECDKEEALQMKCVHPP